MKMPWRRGAADRPGAGSSPDQIPPELVKWASQTSPTLLAWANVVDATGLSDTTVKNAERFLRTYRRTFDMSARREMAMRIRSKIEAEVSPRPPVTIGNMDVIATALQMRRRQLGYGDTGPGSES
jgi:hypothetical protein